MKTPHSDLIERTRAAAVDVLLHNAHGPVRGLPRAAGWGYPEPYTRDLLIASLGILASGHVGLIARVRRVLQVLAENQSPRGHIPSLVHDGEDRGSSDTTPLFLLAAGIYRRATGEKHFLDGAIAKALTWMDYQSPSDRVIVAQLPTSDWRDEQWVLGFGLYVNTIVYSYLRLFGETGKAAQLRSLMGRFTITAESQPRHVHEGLAVRHKPYYALWSYKVMGSERFDLLGNSLAVLSGVASPRRAGAMVTWIERECEALRGRGELSVDLPPSFLPCIRPGDPDWRERYARFNRPGEYHNGGVWPFVCGFYVAALVTAKRQRLAERKLEALARLVRPARDHDVPFGFNEWLRARDGAPAGQDWQTWSAAMFLYADECVRRKSTPFFDEIRGVPSPD
jgi:hypothetical protein